MGMTIQEAIERLKTRDAYGKLTGYTGGYQEVLDTAQRSLEAWQQVLDTLTTWRENDEDVEARVAYRKCIEVINKQLSEVAQNEENS